MPIPPGYARFYLRYRWVQPWGKDIIGATQASLCGLGVGLTRNVQLSLSDMPNWPAGTYLLRLDLYDTARAAWFSSDGWPPYDIPVKIVAPPTPIPSPTVTICPGC